MKGSFAAFAAFASLSFAQNSQNFDGEPSCAVACLTSAISVAGCALMDEGCKCGTGLAAIQTAVSPCLLSACDAADVISAASHGLALCSAYSAQLAVANATTTAVLVSTSISLSAVKTSTTIASTTSVTESTPSPATTSKAATTILKGSTTVGSSASSSKSPSSSASAVATGGAPAMIAGFGGIVGLVAGLMAAL